MKRYIYILRVSISSALVIACLISFYYIYTHKTRYLNIEFFSKTAYLEITGEIYFKDYPNTKIIEDKVAIKKIVEYLNNIPFVFVYGYYDKSKQEFVIPELAWNKRGLLMQDKERYGSLIFYDNNRIEIGRIVFHNEKYIEGLNYHAYKVKNSEQCVISELETLDLD